MQYLHLENANTASNGSTPLYLIVKISYIGHGMSIFLKFLKLGI